MSDLMNAIIAAKLMGNGGGGGGSGLPPIERAEEERVNGSFDFEQVGGSLYATSLPSGFTLVKGKEYVVSWDSANYTCICGEMEEGSGILVLGNLSIIDPSLPDTEESFIIIPMGPGYAVGTPSSEGTHDIIITAINQSPANGALLTVKDGEWVGDMVIPPYSTADIGKVLKVVQNTIQADVTISEAQTLSFGPYDELKQKATIADELIAPSDLSVSNGSVAKLTLDGNDYELLLSDTQPIAFQENGTGLYAEETGDYWVILSEYVSAGPAEISDIVITTQVLGPPKLSFEQEGGE